jgi:hypothetical protein
MDITGKTGLSIRANGHYFIKNGAPFFWMGDTNWPLYIRYTPDEMELYLEHRRRQGFTVIHTMIVFDGALDRVMPFTNTDGELPWHGMNPATPNEAYFKTVDLAVQMACQKELLMVIMPLGGSSGSFIHQKKIITPEVARGYGQWLGNRYKNEPNILWANGADLLPWEYESIYRELAAGLQTGEGGAHLISLHPGGRPGISSSYFQQEDWLAANIIQTWSDYWAIYPLVNEDYWRKPVKPVIMAEGAYEAGTEYPTAPITPLIVRQQAYWTYLAGGFHSYGHNDMWRKNPAWRTSLDAAGAQQMTPLKNLFTSFEWWKLIPDPSIFADGAGSGKTLNAAARSADGDLIIAYLSHPAAVSIHLGKLTAGPAVQARWFDPRTGQDTRIGTFPTREAQTFTPPQGGEDWVIILETISPSK